VPKSHTVLKVVNGLLTAVPGGSGATGVDRGEFMGLVQDKRQDGDREQGRGDVNKILRFALSSPAETHRLGARLEQRDFQQTLDLVEGAAEAMRASEERSQALEARLQAVVQQTASELEKAKALIQAANARAMAAEVRAEEAEFRAQEAEEWLRRMHDAIRRRFPATQPAQAEMERPQSRIA
jgi:hypothetical protein